MIIITAPAKNAVKSGTCPQRTRTKKVMSARYADKREIRKRYLNQSADT